MRIRHRQLRHLKNLTLAINQNSSFGRVLKHKVALEGCQFELCTGNVSRFLLTDDFAQQAYVFPSPTWRRRKAATRHLLAADIGFNPYTSVLITQGDTIRNDADLVRKFVPRFSEAGRRTDDPSKTNAHIQSENPEIDTEILALGAADLKNSAPPEGQPWQHGIAERWSIMARQPEECGFSEAGILKPDAAFTTEFVTSP